MHARARHLWATDPNFFKHWEVHGEGPMDVGYTVKGKGVVMDAQGMKGKGVVMDA